MITVDKTLEAIREAEGDMPNETLIETEWTTKSEFVLRVTSGKMYGFIWRVDCGDGISMYERGTQNRIAWFSSIPQLVIYVKGCAFEMLAMSVPLRG